MSITDVFIKRPVATTLLTIGIALIGIAAYFFLAVAALPTVDYPTVSVSASLPGASPLVMATSVATPLERRLGVISDVTEMTSRSGTNSSNITLQFDLDRDINGAARDVQAAINAARADLPAGLRSNPTYRKINPADQPILNIALSSPTMSAQDIYDKAANIMQQRLLQIQGVGDVSLGGAASPAVRVELNPLALAKYGIGSEDVRAAIAGSNANTPKGLIEPNGRRLQIYTNDSRRKAAEYAPLVIAYRNGSAVRLQDVARVYDGPESLYNLGLSNNKPAVIVGVTRQPGANIVATVQRIKKILPQIEAQLDNIDVQVTSDRTKGIDASLNEVKRSLLISILLVVVVVFVFLRNGKATLIPAVAVVVSLLGTLGVMYVCKFSLDNLSLMALTVATGFVVDDAIVVLENITRHVEEGVPRMQAAIQGAREVAFTVVSMSISLVAVFIPILLMSGLVGRLFREFAVCLTASVLISLVVSLSATPMMAARMVAETAPDPRRKDLLARFGRAWDKGFNAAVKLYEDSLTWTLDHGLVVVAVLVALIGLDIYLYSIVPKGFFPQQDTGTLQGGVQVDQASSFALTSVKYKQLQQIIMQDPAVDTVTGTVGGGFGGMTVQLKPKSERGGLSSDQVSARLRPKLAVIPGAQMFLQTVQDIRVGGRQANAQYQLTLESDNIDDLRTWTAKLTDQLKTYDDLTDVNSDAQDRGLETMVTVDHESATQLGLTQQAVDSALNNNFGQRQVATIYNEQNQYKVVMESDPQYTPTPEALKDVYISAAGAGAAQTTALRQTTGNATQQQTGSDLSLTASRMVPLMTIANYALSTTPTSVNHQGQAVASTISFNLADGKTLSDAQEIVRQAQNAIGMPNNVAPFFRGTAQVFQQSLNDQPKLILAAIIAVYLVLGMLYESYIHPITVISSLPSAGVGAVLSLMIFNIEFDLIALIGVILLIGIVKKNAIMMIDFALQGQRDGLSPREAIHRAAMLRFRPIMMTSFAAILGALPLALGLGEGGELRRPLGLTIVGGLLVSQVLTLLTTPVIYVYMDKLRNRRKAAGPRWLPRGPAFGRAAPQKD